MADIFHDLNIDVPTEVPDFTISAKNYSTFLRILYNSTYLNDSDSEKALDILSKTTFVDGLVAGVPKGTTIAHKFGEHVSSFHEIELHDCGIIYYPQNPYLLCVMTKGQDFSKLAKIIADISAMVYNETASGVLKI